MFKKNIISFVFILSIICFFLIFIDRKNGIINNDSFKKEEFDTNIFKIEDKIDNLDFDDSIVHIDSLLSVPNIINNDSIYGDLLNKKTIIYYKHRFYKKALNSAIISEEFNNKNNIIYNLNSARIDIANIYYHIKDYEKAKHYFLKTLYTYKDSKDYTFKNIYIVTLYSLSKVYLQLEETTELKKMLLEYDLRISELNEDDLELERAYFKYIKGLLSYLEGNYNLSNVYFDESLPVIKTNDDFTNEHIIYLYKGKIQWNKNNKNEASKYFLKIDSLFKRKQILNYELREAYEYLIKYYRESDESKLLIEATDNLIQLNKQFESEQFYLSHELHKSFDSKNIINKNNILEKKLNNNYKYLYIFVLLIVISIFYALFQLKQKRLLRENYNKLLLSISNDNAIESTNKMDNQIINFHNNSDSSLTELRIIEGLKKFEIDKKFLNPIKLEDLANELGTNRTTLSVFLNTHKNGFSSYINELKIMQLTKDLKNNPEYLNYTMQELSEIYGFTTVRSFNIHFKKITGLTPTYFINRLYTNKVN